MSEEEFSDQAPDAQIRLVHQVVIREFANHFERLGGRPISDLEIEFAASALDGQQGGNLINEIHAQMDGVEGDHLASLDFLRVALRSYGLPDLDEPSLSSSAEAALTSFAARKYVEILISRRNVFVMLGGDAISEAEIRQRVEGKSLQQLESLIAGERQHVNDLSKRINEMGDLVTGKEEMLRDLKTMNRTGQQPSTTSSSGCLLLAVGPLVGLLDLIS